MRKKRKAEVVGTENWWRKKLYNINYRVSKLAVKYGHPNPLKIAVEDFMTWLVGKPLICYWCDKDLKDNEHKLHIDHWVSLKAGGANSLDNLVISCNVCNMYKGEFDPHFYREFQTLLAKYKMRRESYARFQLRFGRKFFKRRR